MTDTYDLRTESVSVVVAKNSPPVVVASLTLCGITLQEWVLLATLIYTVINIFLTMPKIIEAWRRLRK